VVLLLVVEAVAPTRAASVMEIGRIAVDQFLSPVVIIRQELVGAAIDLFHRIVAQKIRQRLRVNVDADVVQRRWFPLHDGTAAQVGLDVSIVRRHQGDNRLAQAGGRLRSKVITHKLRSITRCWISSIG